MSLIFVHIIFRRVIKKDKKCQISTLTNKVTESFFYFIKNNFIPLVKCRGEVTLTPKERSDTSKRGKEDIK